MWLPPFFVPQQAVGLPKSMENPLSQKAAEPPEPPRARRRRLPELADGFSVNFCRNTLCELFGELPDPFDNRGRPQKGVKNNLGKGAVVGAGNERSFRCPACGRLNVLKSNLAIAEEYQRLINIYSRTKRAHCTNDACENHGKGIQTHEHCYRKYGATAKGDPRYQCKACGKVFSFGKPNRRHKRKDLARKVLRSLVNGMTLTAIAEVHDVHIKDVYRKLDFIHDACLEFAKEREKCLPACFEG